MAGGRLPAYSRFLVTLFPVAVVGLAVASALLLLLFRRELAPSPEGESPVPVEHAIDRGLLVKSLVVTALLMVAMELGVTPSLAALAAASVRGRTRVGFWSYARVGVPLTLVTLAVGMGWLALTSPR